MEPDYHVPVLLRESIELLLSDSHGTYADCTLGGGGHAAELLDHLGAEGKLLAFDADPGAIQHGRERFREISEDRLQIEQAYFTEAAERIADRGLRLSGVLLDLGISSRQVDSDQIGLSYRKTMPLDMRFDRDSGRPSARSLVNGLSRQDLADLFRRYGEEPAAWTIAGAIEEKRRSTPIETTTELRDVIASVIPERFLMPALSRVFQALRIEVNDELNELSHALERFIELLLPGGRLVVLTYHSLEDRIVKERFRLEASTCVCPPGLPICRCEKIQRLRLLTRKPIIPGGDEILRNTRARSARLRAAERIDVAGQ
jgi:16S rRNA (cytosine1402-N4)-methyltransferase